MSFHQEGQVTIGANLIAKLVRHSRCSVVIMAVGDDGLFLRLHAELLNAPSASSSL
ncbi:MULTISPECIES: hypothetical protein [unclassified Bradyrhizobium]|uniref:hypothetical protein n=1 Tax=unclassified Bradyrhizobium TaxID=2631580 RepID=UPI0028ED74D7|nr:MULTISPECIES: hypothetical protein [unclassified Bradyrhizobium]